MLYVVLRRLSSLKEIGSRLAGLGLLLICAGVAMPAALAQGAAAPARQGVQSPSPGSVTPAAESASTPATESAPPGGEPATPPASTPPASGDAAASEASPSTDTRGLDEDVQGLKKDVVDLNRELFVLEEELLFPANTQVAVFVSMDVGDFFALDSITLKIDQKEVINYLYTPREVEALLKGGVHRLYLGNLKVGQHELVAFFSGKGPNDRDYKRGATLKFEKGIGAKYLELKINDRQRRLQPEFEIKDWE